MQAATSVRLPFSEFMRWPELDRALVIAERRVVHNTGKYGEWLPDAFSERSDPTNYDDPLRPYTRGPHVNQFEKAVLDAEEAHKKKYPDANLHGVSFSVSDIPLTADEIATS